MGSASKRSKPVEEEHPSDSEPENDELSETEQTDAERESDQEGYSDEEGEVEEGEEDGIGGERIREITGGAEMEELEKEYQHLRHQEQDILGNLKRKKDEDALKGQAVKNQMELWDINLEFRFLLQKAFLSANKLPQEPARSLFCSSDKEVDEAYSDLISSTRQTLDSMLELQEELLVKNPAIVQETDGYMKESGKEDLSDDLMGDGDEAWLRVHRMHCRIAPFRNNAVDKWQRKTQVKTGAAAFKGKLSAFNQNISDQVAVYMRDPSRMIKRMRVGKSSVSTFGKVPEESESGKQEKKVPEEYERENQEEKVPGEFERGIQEDGEVDGDPELIDDSEFYQQLLKEFLESYPASGKSHNELKKLLKRKVVDRRASKSRRIRYSVHEKIVNFMSPVPMALPPMATTYFGNVFGLKNQKPTPVS